MSEIYRIFGSEMSPYSVKTRSYFRYKQIPHEWLLRNGEQLEEYKKYARLPIVPTVATPDDEGLQDSTPIIELMETMSQLEAWGREVAWRAEALDFRAW